MGDEATKLWYVQADDETRAPGPCEVTVKEYADIQRGVAGIYRALPKGAVLHPLAAAGAVCLTIPAGQECHVSAVDEAFSSAGYKRDPFAPDQSAGHVV